MNDMSAAQQVVVVILSGGGAAAIFTLVKAWLAIRQSADTREATAIGHLERWRREADERAEHAYLLLGHERDVSSYWQRRAGMAEHVLASHGVAVPECPPPPTSQSRGEPT